MVRFLEQAAFKFFRAGFGIFFLLAGIGHAVGFATTVDGARILSEYFEWSNPASKILAGLAVGFLVFGGLSLVLGWRVRAGALALFLFLIPATFVHALVMQFALNSAIILKTDSNEKAQQIIRTLTSIAVQGHQGNIVKNLVLMCAALFFLAVPMSKTGR